MDGRCIHFYSAKVKPTQSVFLTGAAPHTCMCKSRGGRWQLGGPGRPVSKTNDTHSLEKPAVHVGRVN